MSEILDVERCLPTSWYTRKICVVFELRSSLLSRELDRAFARLRACGTASEGQRDVCNGTSLRAKCFHFACYFGRSAFASTIFRRDLGVGSVPKTAELVVSGTSTCSWTTALAARSGSSVLVSPIAGSQRRDLLGQVLDKEPI